MQIVGTKHNGDSYERSYRLASATRIGNGGFRSRHVGFNRDLLRDWLASVALSLDPGSAHSGRVVLVVP